MEVSWSLVASLLPLAAAHLLLLGHGHLDRDVPDAAGAKRFLWASTAAGAGCLLGLLHPDRSVVMRRVLPALGLAALTAWLIYPATRRYGYDCHFFLGCPIEAVVDAASIWAPPFLVALAGFGLVMLVAPAPRLSWARQLWPLIGVGIGVGIAGLSYSLVLDLDRQVELARGATRRVVPQGWLLALGALALAAWWRRPRHGRARRG